MTRCLFSSIGVEIKDAQHENVVRLRARYFSDDLAPGSKAFAGSVFSENRDKFGPKRRDGARKASESESALDSLR